MTNLTPEAIRATRQRFAEIERACITEVENGNMKVNDREAYFADCKEREAATMRGDYDHTFTFRQYATWVQTGECLALLP